MAKSHNLSIREIEHSQLCEMLAIGIHPKGCSPCSRAWSFDDFLTIDQEDIIDARWKPRSIIIIHKSRPYMMFVSDQHTASSWLKWFDNNIRQGYNIMVESRMICKNHSLVEHIPHFEVYHFLKIFRTWLSKTSCGNQIIELFFRLSESRLF